MPPESDSLLSTAVRTPTKSRIVNKREIKVVLLGSRECGKSTLLKQMKLSYQGDFTAAERNSYKEIVYSNIVQSMCAILTALPDLGLCLAPVQYRYQNTILTHPLQVDAGVLPLDIADAVRHLWLDPSIREAARRSNEFQLLDNAHYYFDAIDRISAIRYQPTNQDILRSRVSTTGISSTKFKLDGLTCNVFDVGGPRSERKKWINCFENVDVVIFLVSLSEYDQILWEDEATNRMQEALVLFDSICNSRWFVKTSMILFLNKIDLFAEKLQHSALNDYFVDFRGGKDYLAACEYFLERFERLDQHTPKRKLYTFFTCVTNTEAVKYSLSTLEGILRATHLNECDPL